MPRIVIGLFSRREDADAARRALIASGIARHQITVESERGADARTTVDQPLPEDAGLAGFIRRMFSGALMDHEGVDRYLLASRHACCLVAVHELAPRDVPTIEALLREHGALNPLDDPGTQRAASDPRRVEGAVVAPFGPDVYPLPNAPTGWRKPRRLGRNTIGAMRRDPGRPEGLTDDAPGLGVDGDRERIGVQQQERARRDPGNAPSRGADTHAVADDGSDKLHGDKLGGTTPRKR